MCEQATDIDALTIPLRPQTLEQEDQQHVAAAAYGAPGDALVPANGLLHPFHGPPMCFGLENIGRVLLRHVERRTIFGILLEPSVMAAASDTGGLARQAHVADMMGVGT